MDREELLKEKEIKEKALKEIFRRIGTARRQLNDELFKKQKLLGEIEMINKMLEGKDEKKEEEQNTVN